MQICTIFCFSQTILTGGFEPPTTRVSDGNSASWTTSGKYSLSVRPKGFEPLLRWETGLKPVVSAIPPRALECKCFLWWYPYSFLHKILVLLSFFSLPGRHICYPLTPYMYSPDFAYALSGPVIFPGKRYKGSACSHYTGSGTSWYRTNTLRGFNPTLRPHKLSSRITLEVNKIYHT